MTAKTTAGPTRKKGQTIREIIGRVARRPLQVWTVLGGRPRVRETVDKTRPDYAFWDKVRRGKQDFYEFGGLFAQSIVEIVSYWVIGDGFRPALTEKPADPRNPSDSLVYTNDVLQRFVDGNLPVVQMLYEDDLALGDQFVVVNADGSLSIPSPDTVDIETDPLDGKRPIAYTVTTVVEPDDGSEKLTTTDRYTATERTITIKVGNQEPASMSFPVLIGRMPVIHFANDRSTNELHGRPIYERLLKLFQRYDDLVVKGVDGAETAGNPIPVFEGLEDPQSTIDLNATEEDTEYTDREGNTQERKEIRWDSLAALFLGKGGSFKWAGPNVGFSDDVRNVLKALFLLVLDVTHIPEFVWGGAINASRASAETQMDPFTRFIKARRRFLEGKAADDLIGQEPEGGLLELLYVWLLTRQLVDPRIVVGPVRIAWGDLTDEEGTLKLEKVKFSYEKGFITAVTALEQLELVDDAEFEVAQGKAEFEERIQAFADPFMGRLDEGIGNEEADDEGE